MPNYLSVETEKENASVAARRASNEKTDKAARRAANEARLKALAAQEKEKRQNPRSRQPEAQKPRPQPKPQRPADMLVLEEQAPPTPKDLASLEYPLDVLIPDEEHIPAPPSIASSFVAPPSRDGDRPPTGSVASRPGTGASRPGTGASRPPTAASAFDMLPPRPPTASRQPTAGDRPPTASRPGTSVSQLQRELQHALNNDSSGRFAQCLQQQGVKILNETPRGTDPYLEGFAQAAVRPEPVALPAAPVDAAAPRATAAAPIVWDTDVSSGRPATGSRPPSSRSRPPPMGARSRGADEQATMAELLVSEAPLSARSSRISAGGKKRIEARAAQSSLNLAGM